MLPSIVGVLIEFTAILRDDCQAKFWELALTDFTRG